MDNRIIQTIEWLQKQLDQCQYSEISVKLIVHAGKIKRIERTLTDKLQINELE